MWVWVLEVVVLMYSELELLVLGVLEGSEEMLLVTGSDLGSGKGSEIGLIMGSGKDVILVI